MSLSQLFPPTRTWWEVLVMSLSQLFPQTRTWWEALVVSLSQLFPPTRTWCPLIPHRDHVSINLQTPPPPSTPRLKHSLLNATPPHLPVPTPYHDVQRWNGLQTEPLVPQTVLCRSVFQKVFKLSRGRSPFLAKLRANTWGTNSALCGGSHIESVHNAVARSV